MNRPANFEDIADFMALTDEDRKILQTTLIQMLSIDVKERGNEDNQSEDDYTSLAIETYEEPVGLEDDEIAAIDAADLTDWEHAVIMAWFMSSNKNGWQ